MQPYTPETSRDPTPATGFTKPASDPNLPNGAARLAGDLKDVGVQSGHAIQRLVHDTTDLAAQGAQAVSHGAQELRERSMRLRDATASYVQHEPVKSVLMAAAAGATLMALATWLGRTSRH